MSDMNCLEAATDNPATDLDVDTSCKSSEKSSSMFSNSAKNNDSLSKPKKITLFHSEGSYYIEMKRTGENITNSDITE